MLLGDCLVLTVQVSIKIVNIMLLQSCPYFLLWISLAQICSMWCWY